MTPERKQWWDNLPQREKILRKELSYLKYQRSKEKERMSFTGSVIVKKTILERINYYTIFIRAVRRKLDRTTVATYTGRYEGVFPMYYRCKKCGGTFENFGQTHCCWCGRKIEGYK
jgi:hypothetical protein